MKTVLVTGGAGFIGHYVRARLFELDIRPLSFDVQTGYDVLKPTDLFAVAEQFDIDGIIHLAGVLGTHELNDWGAAQEAVDINIKGALNVAQTALKFDVPMVSIEQPHIWYNTYEATKFAARRMLTGLALDKGLKVGFVTAHNAFGPRQAHGEGHPQKIIPTFATQAWRGEALPVWGNGKQKLNLVWAGDVADTLINTLIEVQAGEVAVTEQIDAESNLLWTAQEVAYYVIDYVKSHSDDLYPFIEYHSMREGENTSIPYPEPGPDSLPMRYTMLDATIDSYRP